KKIAIFLLLVIPPLSYAENSNWDEFVAGVRSEALAQGIRPEILDEAFSNISGPNLQILRFERNQPEQRITFLKYRETRVDANRIALGRKEFHQYSSLLQKIEKDYRVNSCFVISLWGMETSYGHYLGNFPVIESLATLAYGSKERKDFFRNQLLLALKIL